MKKKNESGAKSSASAVKNQSSNLAEKFRSSASTVLGTFDTLFEFEMDDEFRGTIYLLRQQTTDLIDAGNALVPGVPAAVRATESVTAQAGKERYPFQDLYSSITALCGFVHLVADKLVHEVEECGLENSGHMAAGILELKFRAVALLIQNYESAHEEYVRVSRIVEGRAQ